MRQLATILDRHLRRAGDFVARYGGEEFAMLLPNATAEYAQGLAERVRSEVEADFADVARERGIAMHVTASFGCATAVPELGTTVDALVRVADRNLYLAKERGRNRVVPELTA